LVKLEKKHFRLTLPLMICITLDCVGLTQSGDIQIIHCNVGPKCFFSFGFLTFMFHRVM